ncbi:MAG: dTMP kinase [Candidatus Omnitrophota bacterium]
MAKANLKRGIFITFEGPEGCGKSTHSKLACEYLKNKGYDCVCTREPGGTKLGEGIRQVLLHSDGIEISDLAELFLFEAARSQIVAELIKPSLAGKKIVICDRFSDATTSYQGYGGKIPLKTIKILDRAATGGLEPDATILLDINTGTGLARAKAKGADRMEAKDTAYHKRVRSGYLKLAKNEPSRIRVIKVTGSIEETQVLVRHELDAVIRKMQ